MVPAGAVALGTAVVWTLGEHEGGARSLPAASAGAADSGGGRAGTAVGRRAVVGQPHRRAGQRRRIGCGDRGCHRRHRHVRGARRRAPAAPPRRRARLADPRGRAGHCGRPPARLRPPVAGADATHRRPAPDGEPRPPPGARAAGVALRHDDHRRARLVARRDRSPRRRDRDRPRSARRGGGGRRPTARRCVARASSPRSGRPS